MQPTTCDRHTVERFLADGLDDAERAAFEDHLGECATCRNSLDELAAGGAWWQEARGYLSSANPDVGSMPTGDDAPDSAADDLFGLKGYLGPTDDPHMLGRLGGYEVVGVVGTGGMGVVLKAFEAPLNRYVAIKALGPQLATSGAARQRFAREAKAAAAVVHDNVIAIHAVAEAAGLPYIVMPYVRGSSLEKRLRDAGAFGTDEVLRVGLQVARGLAAAHAQGLVHRDIKPANILLEGGVERVWITDFGLARAVDDASLTRSGVIAGTPQYMSPEQAAGDRVDHRSDLFSLGSVLYALCTGRPPFRASTTLAVLRRVEEDRPRPIREINPDVPEWLVRVVETLMAKDPADRFQSAAAVADLFEGYLAHRRQPATRPAPDLPPPPAAECVELRPTPRRRWVAPAVVALVVGLALGVAQLPPMFAPAEVVALPTALVPAGKPPVKPVDFYQDFRGDGPLPPAFKPYATEQVTLARDADGLRIAVPVRPGNNMAGIDLKRRFTGDFEITAGYELLKADRPTVGHGVGFVLRVETATARPSDFAFFRMTRVEDGDVYWASRTTTGDDGKQDFGQPDKTPATARGGLLRITRVGDEASFAVADGPAGEFRKLFQRYVGPEDITSIRLAAFPGWDKNPVEVRVKDLRVRASTPTGPPPTSAAPTTVIAQDFRGKGPALPLQPSGPGHATVIKPEAGGLRITLPPGRQPSVPVGVALGAGLRGDFDIAAAYELIQVETPKPGDSAGFEVYVAADTPGEDAISYCHVTRADGTAYQSTRMATADGKRQYRTVSEPATGTAGRLRLTRRGGEVTLWAAEAAGDYREVHRYDFGPADLKAVRFTAFPGQKSNGVDLRITDVRIQDGPVSPDAPTVVVAVPAKPFRAAGLPALLAYGMAATLSLAGVWAVVRRRRQRPAAEPPAPGTIAFACAGCGRRMVVKAEWAGKKGRCVHCKREMVVPQPAAVEPTTVTIAKARQFVLPSGHNLGLIAVALLGLSLIATGLLSSAAPADEAGPVTRLSGHTGPVHNVRFTPDGKRLVSGSGWPDSDQTVRVWDVATGQGLLTVKVPGSVHSLELAPDGRHALAGLNDGNVAYLDLESGSVNRLMKVHGAAVGWVAFAPDGKRGLSTSDEGTAAVWDLEDGTVLARYSVRSKQARGGVLLPDGRRLLTADSQGVVQVWDINAPNELKVIDLGNPWMIDGLSLTPDGRQVLIACVGGVRLYDIESGREVRHFQEGTEEAHQAVASPDGRWLIAADMTGVVRLWNLQTGELIRALGKHNDIAFTVAFSPDGRVAASGGGGERRDDKFVAGTDHDIRLWHLADAAPKPAVVRGTWLMLAGAFVLALAAGGWLVGRRFGNSEAKA